MEKASISVRRATLAELPEVARIHVRSWQHAYRGQLPDAVLDALDIGEREARWRSNFGAPAQVLLLGVRNDRILGFCELYPSRDADAKPATAEITAIYADPEHYRSGTGAALMAAALDEARRRGDRVLTLWVIETNPLSRRFYERHGLRWDGSEKHLERPGYALHELRYRIELAPIP